MTSSIRLLPKIKTYTGIMFDLQNPSPSDIDIYDIAHALSNICRYTGHCDKFYSVAQHSVIVSYLVDKAYAKEALLHDASEAYLGDVSRPLKQLLPDYLALEKNIMKVVGIKFDIPSEMSCEVSVWDDLIPRFEMNLLTTGSGFNTLSSEEAEKLFLKRYKEIYQYGCYFSS